MKVNGQLENAGIEQLTSAPTPAYPGRMYMNITSLSAAYPQIYNGSAWQSILTAYQNTSYDIINAGIACSVASNALTISLKQLDASTDPSAGSPVFASFRSTTEANGSYTQASAIAATSLVVPSGGTLGMSNGIAKYLWVYLVNNAGTLVLGISGTRFDEGTVQSTTAISNSSDSVSVIYTTSSLSNKAIRLIGRLNISETAAGTWASLPTEITNTPKNGLAKCVAAYYADNTTYSNSNIVQWNNLVFDNFNAVTTGSAWLFTCPAGCAGPYKITLTANILSANTTGWLVYHSGSLINTWINAVAGKLASATSVINLAAGDTIQIKANGALQMENATSAADPNILIEQMEWV